MEQGCWFLDLGVWPFNKEAIAFYECCGMTERTRRMECSLECLPVSLVSVNKSYV